MRERESRQRSISTEEMHILIVHVNNSSKKSTNGTSTGCSSSPSIATSWEAAQRAASRQLPFTVSFLKEKVGQYKHQQIHPIYKNTKQQKKRTVGKG